MISAEEVDRGETVKAIVVPKDATKGKPTAQDIVDWCRERMGGVHIPPHRR